MIPDILVAPLRVAEQILRDFEKRRQYRFYISIGDPPEDPPRGFGLFDGPKLRLLFDDVCKVSPVDGWTLASIAQVEQLIDFCDEIDGPTLINCYAGISRSAAAACILTTIKLGPGKEHEALRHAHGRKPSIFPNKHVLNLADQLLGRGGKLLEAAFEIWPQPQDSVEAVTIPQIRPRKVAAVR
jgi:predicted protein tyrosine phosphatase